MLFIYMWLLGLQTVCNFVHYENIKYSIVNFKVRIIFLFEQMVTIHYVNI